MAKCIAIGELLIDFIPNQKGIALKDVASFEKAAGGAPANVAACVSKLGKDSIMLTKLGNDAFADYLINELNKANVDTSYILKTNEANTALAYVSLKEDGDRDFLFYRDPSADMLLDPDEIKEEIFKPNDILHFCSVDLIESPMKLSHIRAINYALKHQCIISFDPNLRFALWNDLYHYRDTILEFIPKAHILKISSDELEFITNIKDTQEALNSLFIANVEVIIYTNGSKDASIITKNGSITIPSLNLTAKDTTGAGDAFIGAIIYQIINKNITLNNLNDLLNGDILLFAHKVSGHVVLNKGAIPSMPKLEDII